MHVGVYGSGYLGTVISACLADFGTPVTCCDTDSTRMVEMAQGNICFFEKNLKEIVRRNVRCGRLAYSTDVEAFSKRAHVIFLAEDTAENLEELVLRIVRQAIHPLTFSLVTPLPVGTATRLEKAVKSAKLKANIVSQPMFFTDGCAVEDFNWPDRIILGATSSEAVATLKQIFHPLVMRGVPVVVTNHETAELVREKGVELKVLSAAREVNAALAERLVAKISTMVQSVQNKEVGILGLAFKPNTNSVAGSSSIRLAQTLLAKGAKVRAYDPAALADAKMQLNGTVRYCETAYAVAEGVDALVVGTGWPEFRTLDFAKIKHLLKRPIIVDTKNLLDSTKLRSMGFQYVGIGRGESLEDPGLRARHAASSRS